MKKKILSQLMILSFAFAGLFLVGNNVKSFAGYKDFETIPPAITCGQFCGFCWRETSNVNVCIWDGRMRFRCWGNCP